MLPKEGGAGGRTDAANPLGVGGTSYLCLLSLQTREAQVHHEGPWGLLVLSGLWVLPCQDLLKMGMTSLTVSVPCHIPQRPLLSRTVARASSRPLFLFLLLSQPRTRVTCEYATSCPCPKSAATSQFTGSKGIFLLALPCCPWPLLSP